MSARKQARKGGPARWYFRKQLQAHGATHKLFGYADDFGQPNSKEGALAAEAVAVARVLGEAPAPDSPRPVAATPTMARAEDAPGSATFAEAAELWLAKSRADDKPSTASIKASSVRSQLLPHFGHLKLSELTAALLEEWRLHLRDVRELAPQSIATQIKNVRAILHYARLRGLLREVPTMPRQRLDSQPPKFLPFEDVGKLIMAADGAEPWRDMIVIAVRTGMRIGEILALRWKDVDLTRGFVNVVRNWTAGFLLTPKSGKGRPIPLSRDAVAVLDHRRRRANIGPDDLDDLVFPGEGGRFLQYAVSRAALASLARRAGMEPFGWHRLRHTFATHLVMRGVNPRTVQDLLGHANINTTMRYMHAMPEFTRAAVNLLDESP